MSSRKTVTTACGSMVTKADEEKMKEKKKEICDKVRKNKFTFNIRGEITPKEQRTYGNVFDWVKKGK